MKILVIDDTQKHLDSAVQTLIGHEVTLCPSYDEALGLLEQKFDYEKRRELCGQYKTNGLSYKEAAVKADQETLLPYWDVVLSDLLMPVGEHTNGQKIRRMVGEEFSFGLALGLTAARYGAKYVGILTDADHHSSPASSMLDTLDNECSAPHIFTIDGARVLITNRVHYFEFEGEEEEVTCYSCHGQKGKYHEFCRETNAERCYCQKKGICSTCNGTGTLIKVKKGKHWGKLLDRLLA